MFFKLQYYITKKYIYIWNNPKANENKKDKESPKESYITHLHAGSSTCDMLLKYPTLASLVMTGVVVLKYCYSDLALSFLFSLLLLLWYFGNKILIVCWLPYY